MPFKLQGSSMLVIQPCYDGRVLPITHQVAAEGLALLSIKEPHHDCTLIRDPGSKLSSLSCTQGIKPRNSFWNLHKPELRKVRGLDCTKMENVVELFQTHNTESSSAKSYRKRVVSKLGSIINKKLKPATQPQVLVKNVSWPINCCVLSSICQETEIVSSDILRKEEIEKTIKKHDFEGSNSKIVDNEEGKDTVFITLPSNMHENTSDDLISVSEFLNPSNGDSSTNTLPPFNKGNPRVSLGYDGSYGTATSQVMSSSILLESKQSQHQISIPSNVEFYEEKKLKENCVIVMDKANMMKTNENNQHEKNKINEVNNVNWQDNGSDSPPSIAVQSIFSDIFQEIEEIKCVINSYMSSFYVQEEEYNNFPKLHTSSQEVASHFLKQIHGPLKDQNCNRKNMHSNACNDCIPEECYIKKGASITAPAVDINVQNRNSLQKNTEGNAINIEAGKETSSSYCYWEDNDLEGEFTTGKLSGKIECCSFPERNINSELVTLEFIENMWEEFTNQVETHALFIDLVNENELKKCEHGRHFPSYGHWANMYDPNIFQEAENIVYTLDSLLMDGCFPTDESINTAYVPCTIIELANERELSSSFEYGPSENRDKPANQNGNVSIEQECQVIPHEYEADSAADIKNENFMLIDPLAKEITNRKKIHEIKLEPVFYQEKVVLHEVDYSRVPEYEKIQLDPINHEGRVDFSTLQSNGANFDSSTVEKYETEEQINKHIISKENLSQKYVNEEYRPNKECFFKDNSKSQPTLEKNYDIEPLTDKLDEDNSDTSESMFEKIQERNNPGNPNSAFLFSSPTVQINLTNPFVNTSNK